MRIQFNADTTVENVRVVTTNNRVGWATFDGKSYHLWGKQTGSVVPPGASAKEQRQPVTYVVHTEDDLDRLKDFVAQIVGTPKRIRFTDATDPNLLQRIARSASVTIIDSSGQEKDQDIVRVLLPTMSRGQMPEPTEILGNLEIEVKGQEEFETVRALASANRNQ